MHDQLKDKTYFYKERTVYLPNAYHPLLNKDTVVANTIEFIDDIETVIITGPNTGGKTVTLKNVRTYHCDGSIRVTHSYIRW